MAGTHEDGYLPFAVDSRDGRAHTVEQELALPGGQPFSMEIESFLTIDDPRLRSRDYDPPALEPLHRLLIG